MSNRYHSKVMSELERIRKEEENALRNRKDEVYKKIPRIFLIDQELSKLSLKLALNSIKSNNEEVLKNLKTEITSLRDEKYSLFKENGYPLDYFELKYHCEKCNDTGFIKGKKCTCYKNLMVNEFFSDSEFNSQLKDFNFSNYDITLFDDKKVYNGVNMTLREMMNSYLNYLNKYINKFEEFGDNLLIYGETGTGKTFLSTSVAKELLERGYFVVYRTIETLISDLRKIKFQEEGFIELEDMLYNCDLLIIDDLGTEYINDFSRTELFSFINKKLLMKKKMIISTNFTLNELKEMYSERLFSRLAGDFRLMPFLGDDLRLKKSKSILSSNY